MGVLTMEKGVSVVLLIAVILSACCVEEEQETTTSNTSESSSSTTSKTTTTTWTPPGEQSKQDGEVFYICVDSDGMAAANRGSVWLYKTGGGESNYNDHCLDNDTVLEYYCDDAEMINTTVDCRNGYACVEGACTDIHSEKKPNGMPCADGEECASGNCAQCGILCGGSRLCCDVGDCVVKGHCHKKNTGALPCFCRNGQIVACTTTTSRWN
jgi:hypothetical protein